MDSLQITNTNHNIGSKTENLTRLERGVSKQ